MYIGLLIKILKAYGIPEIFVEFIVGMYTGTTARVVNADDMTEAGAIPAVVLLVDTLAPY